MHLYVIFMLTSWSTLTKPSGKAYYIPIVYAIGYMVRPTAPKYLNIFKHRKDTVKIQYKGFKKNGTPSVEHLP